MKAKIRRANPTIALPGYETADAACFDFAAYEDVLIQPKQLADIHTGLYIEAPEGYFLAIFPRSSTPRKKGLMFPHSVGIIDPDYAGPDDEVILMVHNFTDQPVQILKGQKIAQGMFLPITRIEWTEVDRLRDKTRGGFGSTGN